MGPDRKKAKLANLVGLKGVTESGLSSILASLREEGLLHDDVGGVGRKQRASHVDRLVQQETPYGATIQRLALPTDQEPFDWHVVNPFAYLNLLAQTVPAFGLALKAKLEANPCSPDRPWNIIYYCDEATARALFHVDSSRKAWVFYWSFMELGELLTYDSCWMLGGVLRTKRVLDDITGGLTATFKRHLRLFFADDLSFRQHGVSVHCADGSVLLIWATLRFTISDEAALNRLWCCDVGKALRIKKTPNDATATKK